MGQETCLAKHHRRGKNYAIGLYVYVPGTFTHMFIFCCISSFRQKISLFDIMNQIIEYCIKTLEDIVNWLVPEVAIRASMVIGCVAVGTRSFTEKIAAKQGNKIIAIGWKKLYVCWLRYLGTTTRVVTYSIISLSYYQSMFIVGVDSCSILSSL